MKGHFVFLLFYLCIMVRFGVRDYVEVEMRYERRVREKERRFRDYDEEK